MDQSSNSRQKHSHSRLDNSPANGANTVFHSLRPDIIILSPGHKITCLELTVCHETNLESAHARKVDKYKNLADDLLVDFSRHTLAQFFIEISVLGFISNISDFLHIFN